MSQYFSAPSPTHGKGHSAPSLKLELSGKESKVETIFPQHNTDFAREYIYKGGEKASSGEESMEKGKAAHIKDLYKSFACSTKNCCKKGVSPRVLPGHPFFFGVSPLGLPGQPLHCGVSPWACQGIHIAYGNPRLKEPRLKASMEGLLTQKCPFLTKIFLLAELKIYFILWQIGAFGDFHNLSMDYNWKNTFGFLCGITKTGEYIEVKRLKHGMSENPLDNSWGVYSLGIFSR